MARPILQPTKTKRETALHGIIEQVSARPSRYHPHSYPRTTLAGAGFGRIRPDVEQSQNKEKPAGYQRVIGWFRTVSDRSGRAKKGHLVTRRVTQHLASMRVCGHKIGLLPTLLPTSAFWGCRGGVVASQEGAGARRRGTHAGAAPPPTGPALRHRAYGSTPRRREQRRP